MGHEMNVTQKINDQRDKGDEECRRNVAGVPNDDFNDFIVDYPIEESRHSTA